MTAKERRLLLLRDLYRNGPRPRRDLDAAHSRASEDLTWLRRLGLVMKVERDHPHPPLWLFVGGG